MCFNCGCGAPADGMGSPKLITTKTFEEAAKEAGQSPQEAMKNTFKLLKKMFEEKEK